MRILQAAAMAAASASVAFPEAGSTNPEGGEIVRSRAEQALVAVPAVRRENHEKAEFLRHADRHPWVAGMPAPTSFKEAGLLDDAKIVWMGFYFDGGTRGYLLKDSAGNYFAFCTGPGGQTKTSKHWIDAPLGSRILIGALHYTHDGAQLVDAGSKSEEFLKDIAWRAEHKWMLNPPAKPVTDTTALTGRPSD